MEKIKVLIADDHKLVREGLEAILSPVKDFKVIGMAPSGEEAVNLARTHTPHVVLMDIVMPGMTGIEAARWIKEIDPHIRIILLTMEITREYVSAGIKSGVDGYLPKDISKRSLVEAIRAVYRGERYFNESVKKMVFEDFYSVEKLRSPKRKLPTQLTQRETEVLGLVAEGKSNKEVAEMLEISVKTVETHKTHILIKLGLSKTSELVHFAIKNQIISI